MGASLRALERAWAQAEFGVGRLQMNRDGIVNAGGNAALAQCGLHALSILNLYNVEVVDVALVVQVQRRFDADFAKKPVVRRGMTAASIVPSIEVAKLNVEYGGLQRIQPAVVTLDDVFVLFCLAQIAQQV